MLILKIIKEINEVENIDILENVKQFEKKLIKTFKEYDNLEGLEDFKMSELDYIILYSIWKTLNIKNSIMIYITFIYCYFKLEEIVFPFDRFKNINMKNLVDIIKNTDIVKIANNFIF